MINPLNQVLARLYNTLPAWVGVLLFGGAGVFYFWLIYQGSTNLLFLDHWELYAPLMQEERPGWWDLFSFQHGPHRQGVGWMLQLALDALSGWDMRWVAAASGLLMAASAGVFYAALKDLVPRVVLWVALAALCFSPVQWEVFAATPNLSHGPMPVLLLALCAKVVLGTSRWRWPLLVALNFGLVFTAFGLFAGLLVPVLALFELRRLHAKRGVLLMYFFLTLGTLAVFFVGYGDVRAASQAQFLHGGVGHYLQFMAHALSNAVGARGAGWPSVLAGGLLLCLLGWAFLHSLIQLVAAEPNCRSQLVFVLVGFTLLFVSNVALGRISSGVEAGKASRYFPYLIPGLLGALVQINTLKKAPAVALAVLVLGLLVGYFRMGQHLEQLEAMHQKKEQWVATFLRTHNVQQADAACGCKVHPHPEKTRLEEKLAYLEAHGLSFFKGH